MIAQQVDAATAGFKEGYDSPSRFSRAFKRLFGAPPARDIARLQGVFHIRRAAA
jgi:AraC-like DNA-binding protein